MTRIAIEARDLHLAYKRKPILNHLNLAVPKGAVLGLVGRNGAGKSTLMRCLTGLIQPTQGRCWIGDSPSEDLADAVRERLGVVSQTPDPFEWLTAEQHFEQIGTMFRDWQHERAWALAGQLDLPLFTTARELSLGDQQKLAVVLALGHDPDWLLLDEPVASLDPVARRAFMRALFDRVEREEPRTVIISSHLLSDLERVVSHVAFMRQGRIQLMDAWDVLAEQVRCVQGPTAPPPDCVLARTADGRWIVDLRRAPPGLQGDPMNLEDLFEGLNA
jgi:ABC-2 type transport system ATP-binding protein